MEIKQGVKGALDLPGDKGAFAAVLATYGEIDSQGDILELGAVPDGTRVRVAQFGHTYDAPPIGKATLTTVGRELIGHGELFLGMAAAKETYESLKGLGTELGQWSWGYNVKASRPDKVNGEAVRRLLGVEIFEISPVLIGASAGNRTASIKGQRSRAGGTPIQVLQEVALVQHEIRRAGLLLTPEQVRSDLEEAEIKELQAVVDRAMTRPVAPTRADRILAALLAADQAGDEDAQPRENVARAHLLQIVDEESRRLQAQRPGLSDLDARAAVWAWLRQVDG